jgi:hypothetical protein
MNPRQLAERYHGLLMNNCERIEHWNNEGQVIIDEMTAPSVGERAVVIYCGKSTE